MGNLADELADAFTDSCEEDGDYDEQIDAEQGTKFGDQGLGGGQHNGLNTSSTWMVTKKDGALGVPSPHRKSHQRKESQYDGSEYGSESDLDQTGMSPSLVARIDAVESLARRGTENYGGPADDVLKRVTDGLRDLGSQSSVEGSASRCVSQETFVTIPR